MYRRIKAISVGQVLLATGSSTQAMTCMDALMPRTQGRFLLLGNCSCIALISDIPVTMQNLHFRHDMHGCINAAMAGCHRAALDGQMRRSGDLDWTLTFLTDLNIDMAYRDVDQGREQERKL